MAKIIQYSRGGLEFDLNEPVVSIGRHPSNDIQIFNQNLSRREALLVSRFHATIFKEGNHYHLIDHSLNQTIYNPERGDFKGNKSTTYSSVIGTRSGLKESEPTGENLVVDPTDLLETMTGYQRGKFCTPETYQEVLDLLVNEKERMLRESVKLSPGCYIGVPSGEIRTLLMFTSDSN